MSYKLGTWDTLRDLGGFNKRLSKFFGGDGAELLSLQDDIDWAPAVDVTEDDESYALVADLPDVSKEDVQVTMKNGMLTLSGERQHEEEEKGKRYHRIERSYGKYQRHFRIPEDVDTSAITADFNNGVLKVLLPKNSETKSQEEKIEINT